MSTASDTGIYDDLTVDEYSKKSSWYGTRCGSYGTVVIKKMALKEAPAQTIVIKKQSDWQELSPAVHRQLDLELEINALLMQHPHINIAKPLAIDMWTKSIVFEYAGEPIYRVGPSYLHKHVTNVTWRLVFEMSSALRHMHRLNYMHGDISGYNVLYDKKRGRFVIVDWGLAKQLDGHCPLFEDVQLGDIVGPLHTYYFAAPELWEPSRTREHTKQDLRDVFSEVYALGQLAFYVETGCHLWRLTKGSSAHIVPDKSAAARWRDIAEVDVDLFNLIRKMVQKNPRRRPSMDKAYEIALTKIDLCTV